MHAPENHLVIWPDRVLFLGSNPRKIVPHQHPMIQWVLAEEEPFRSKDDRGQWQPKEGLLIGPNYTHECDATDVPILTVGIDPESDFGEWLMATHLAEAPLKEWRNEGPTAWSLPTVRALLMDQQWPQVRHWMETYFGYRGQPSGLQKDERIRRVLNYLADHITEPLATPDLQEVAHLSESRLLHLFKQEMGLPIRNYLRWYRLHAALRHILRGESLTQAAHLAGFADQAHFSRTCSQMLGVPPKLLVHNSNPVQVSLPD